MSYEPKTKELWDDSSETPQGSQAVLVQLRLADELTAHSSQLQLQLIAHS